MPFPRVLPDLAGFVLEIIVAMPSFFAALFRIREHARVVRLAKRISCFELASMLA